MSPDELTQTTEVSFVKIGKQTVAEVVQLALITPRRLILNIYRLHSHLIHLRKQIMAYGKINTRFKWKQRKKGQIFILLIMLF